MRHLLGFLFIAAVVSGFLSPQSQAQDEPRAAWAITNYDLTVPAIGNERALTVHAVITAKNIGRGSGATLTVRLSPTAEMKAISIGSATATFQTRPETRGSTQRGAAQRVAITLPSS